MLIHEVAGAEIALGLVGISAKTKRMILIAQDTLKLL